MKHSTLKKSLSMLMAAVMSVQLFLPAVSHAVESAPVQTTQEVQTLAEGIRQFDDRDPAIRYSKEWQPYNEPGHFNNTITYTLTPGATMDFTFRGTGLILYGQKTFNSGTMEISVDGQQTRKVDFYSSVPTGEKKVAVYVAMNLAPDQEHTLHAVLLDERNPNAGNCQVALDAISVKDYDEPPVEPEVPDPTVYDNNMKLWYKNPANRWETEALPLGNGHMGAMVFGQVAHEKVQINDKNLWIGGPGGVEDYTGGVRDGVYVNLEPLREALRKGDSGTVSALANSLIGKNLSDNGWGAYQNIGDILFHFDGIKDGERVSHYRRELDLINGLAGVFYTHNGVRYTREYLVSYPDNVMAFHFTADQAGKLNFTLDPQIDTVYPAHQPDTPPNVDPNVPIKTFTRTAEGALITVRGVLTENQMEFEVQYRVVTDGKITANENGTLTIADAADAVVYVATGTNYANESLQWTELHNPPDYRGEDPHDDITARIANAVKKGYEAVKKDHVADVSAVMSRVELDIGQGENDVPTDQLVTGYGGNDRYDRMAEMLMFQYGRYLILGSSRTGSLPANLQGVWNNSNKPAWSGDYHCNVNLQMNYWPTGIANVDEATQSLVDYLETVVVPGRFTAAEHHGVRDGGWTVHTSNNPFGMTAPGWSFYWGWSPAANAWLCQNLWDVYQFNQNKEVLKDQIYPIMREAAEFWTKNLVDDGHGGLVSSPTYSPEHGPITEGNAYEQSLIYQLMQDTVQAAVDLDIRDGADKEFCDLLTDIMGKLHPYAIGSWGQIKEWREEDEWETRFTHGEERGHRHMSHMLGLYPGNQITRDTPELLEAAKVTLTDRGDGGTGWSKALKVSNWARVGDGNHALLIFKEFLKHNVYTNLFAYHPPFQIDGNLGITAGAAEMLLQSHTGYIQPLPAMPDDWAAQGSVKGLVARGNFVVDMDWTAGALQTLDVTARSGGTCRIYLPDFKGNMPTDSKGVPVKASYEDGILSFDTVKGETYHYTIQVSDPVGAAAALVDARINAIGTVTLEDEARILAARQAYDGLSQDSRKLVTKLALLESAEKKLAELKAQYAIDLAAAQAVDQKIDAIGTVTLEDEARIAEARKAYDKLTQAQKELVKGLDKLTAAEDLLTELKAQLKEDEVVAAELDAMIEAIGPVTLDSEKAIHKARVTYNNMTPAQQKLVTKLEVLKAAERKLEDLKEAVKFSDVKDTDWFARGVGYTTARGMFRGISATEFGPNVEMSRAMVVQVLYSYAGKPDVQSNDKFSDVPAREWYAKAVAWAVENGVASGVGGGKFAPELTVTREQLAVMLHSFAGNPAVSTKLDFADAGKVSGWAEKAMEWAVASKLMGSVSTEAALLAPQAALDRAQAATIMMNYDLLKK